MKFSPNHILWDRDIVKLSATLAKNEHGALPIGMNLKDKC